MFNGQFRVAACVVALCMGIGPLAAETSNWRKEVADAEGFREGDSILLKYAQRGNVSAQAYLAHIRMYGAQSGSLRTNTKEAWQWYQRVFEETDASMQLDLGYDYLVVDDRYGSPLSTVNTEGRLWSSAYLWLSLGIARHPRPNSRTLKIAKSNLYHLTRLFDVSEEEEHYSWLWTEGQDQGQHLYHRIVGGDPIAQRYHVREAQELLQRLGHSPGPADGKWGPRSERAFTAWVEQSGLLADSAKLFNSWMRSPRLKKVPFDGRIVLRKMRQAALSRHRTDSAATRSEPTLVRFVCQSYIPNLGHYRSVVIVLEQTSMKGLSNRIGSEDDDIFGSYLMDASLDYIFSAPFEMKAYNASLLSSEWTRDEIANKLSDMPIATDSEGEPMVFSGEGTNWTGDFSFFEVETKIKFTIDLDNLHLGFMSYYDNYLPPLHDGGNYHCEEPILIRPSG